MKRTITQIPATKTLHTHTPLTTRAKRKVAGYARVSTDMEEQQSSYQAQVDYYTRYITSHPNWILTGIYTDEGISGTSTKGREGFKTMIKDALAGKIDLIITKSVSRFARNTVDTLTHVRQLKEAGVEVYFEKENIWTLDAKGELLITIMSSLAQEESRSISENVTWGHRKRFADGKVMMSYSQFLGYTKGDNGQPIIDEDEAKIIRSIYLMCLEGMNPTAIARTLTTQGILTPRGKKTWTATTVRSILTNEKYKGDALLQKTFTTDFLTKKTKTNEGEVPQYYVTGSHPAIINEDIWAQAQHQLTQHKAPTSKNIFGTKLICSICGKPYGRKIWHSTDAYKKAIWQCNYKYKTNHPTPMPHLSEADIKHAYTKAVKHYLQDKTELKKRIYSLITDTLNTSSLEARKEKLETKLEKLYQEIETLITTNATSTNQAEADYQNRYEKLNTDYEKTQADLTHLEKRIETQQHKAAMLKNYLENLDHTTDIFTIKNWNLLIDHATITPQGHITFTFKDGTTITEDSH